MSDCCELPSGRGKGRGASVVTRTRLPAPGDPVEDDSAGDPLGTWKIWVCPSGCSHSTEQPAADRSLRVCGSDNHTSRACLATRLYARIATRLRQHQCNAGFVEPLWVRLRNVHYDLQRVQRDRLGETKKNAFGLEISKGWKGCLPC